MKALGVLIVVVIFALCALADCRASTDPLSRHAEVVEAERGKGQALLLKVLFGPLIIAGFGGLVLVLNGRLEDRSEQEEQRHERWAKGHAVDFDRPIPFRFTPMIVLGAGLAIFVVLTLWNLT